MAENTVLLGFRARNIRGYGDKECSFSFVTERIADEDKAESAYSPFSGSLHDRKVNAVYGINASGKTTLLSLIRFVLSVYLGGKDLDDSHCLLRRFHDGKEYPHRCGLLFQRQDLHDTFRNHGNGWRLRVQRRDPI